MRIRPIQFTAIVVCLALSAGAVASPTTLNINSAGNTSVSLHHVMYTDGVDNRDFMSKNVASTDPEMHIDLTPDEMEIIKKTTGHIVCGDASGTVDVGMELDEIIAPMHALKIAKGRKCTFQTFGGEKIKVQIARSAWATYKKWDRDGRIPAGEFLKLKLERPISGVEQSELIPYMDKDFKLKLSTRLVAVSGFQGDWNKIKRVTRSQMREPLAYRCSPTGVNRTHMSSAVYTSNCDVDYGASGSKLYTRDQSGELIKVGMLVRVFDLDNRGNIIPNGTKSSTDGLHSRFIPIYSEMVGSAPTQEQPQETKPAASTSSTTSAQSSNQLSQRSNFAICSRALNSDHTAFDDRGFYKDEIEEAKRRGFDVEKCRAEIATKLAQ